MEIWHLIDQISGEVKVRTSSDEAAELFRRRPVEWKHVVIVKGDYNIRIHAFSCCRFGEYCSFRDYLVLKKDTWAAIERAERCRKIWGEILHSREVSDVASNPDPLAGTIGTELAACVEFMVLMIIKGGCKIISPVILAKQKWSYVYSEAHKLSKTAGFPYKVIYQHILGVIVICPETQPVVAGFEFKMATSQKKERS